jgi:hypothetical protein
MPVEALVDVEQVEPTLDDRGPAAVVDLLRDRAQDAGRVIDVPGRMSVEERRLGVEVRLVPGGRAAVQHRQQVRLLLGEVPLQELAEEMVVPVPAAMVVELDEEQVLPLDLLQLRSRALAAQHSIAERRAHALEDGRPPQEAEHTRLEPREIFGAEVVRDVAVVTPGPGRLALEPCERGEA